MEFYQKYITDNLLDFLNNGDLFFPKNFVDSNFYCKPFTPKAIAILEVELQQLTIINRYKKNNILYSINIIYYASLLGLNIENSSLIKSTVKYIVKKFMTEDNLFSVLINGKSDFYISLLTIISLRSVRYDLSLPLSIFADSVNIDGGWGSLIGNSLIKSIFQTITGQGDKSTSKSDIDTTILSLLAINRENNNLFVNGSRYLLDHIIDIEKYNMELPTPTNVDIITFLSSLGNDIFSNKIGVSLFNRLISLLNEDGRWNCNYHKLDYSIECLINIRVIIFLKSISNQLEKA